MKKLITQAEGQRAACDIYPLNLDDPISVADRDLPYDWRFGVLNRFLLWKDDSTSTCRDGHYFDCMCHGF